MSRTEELTPRAESPAGPAGILNSPEGFQVKHTINLDWLELIVSGNLVEFDSPLDKYEYNQGEIVLAKLPMGTKIFKYSFEIFFRGKLFGKVHTNPRNPEILKPEYIQFQIQNNKLYEVGAIADCRYIFTKLSWAYVNTTRIDIALDGVNVLQLMDRFVKGEIQKLGKAKVKPFFTGKRVIEGFDVGSKASNKWITGYNKSDELERTGKDYIREFWERSGLDTSRTIERLELKLRNEEIKKIFQYDWKELDNFEFLASIFRSTMKNFFEFIEPQADSNVTRAKRMEFVDWENIGAKLLPKMSTKETNEIYRMKQSAKTNYWCYLASGRKYYADIAQEQAMNVNALEWYATRLDKWKEEFNKRAGYNKDGLISFQYILNFETYESNQQLKLFEKE